MGTDELDDGRQPRTEQKWDHSEWERLQRFLKKKRYKGATFIKGLVLDAIDMEEKAPTRAFDPVPVLGVIAAGQAIDVIPFDDVFVTPPDEMRPGTYVLLVAGDSMEAERGLSIPNRSYAMFNRDAPYGYGAPVHVEWEDESGGRVCTFKLFHDHGHEVEFKPLNPKHKSIIREPGTFEVRGVYMGRWPRDAR